MAEKKKILVVDDSSINLAVVEQTLRGKYDVIAVNSGVRALRYLERERPDLFLLDVRMGQKDGIETLKEIRFMESGPRIPVIMLTSRRDRETVVETTKLGIYGYVLKPFVPEDLHNRIEAALARAAIEAAKAEIEAAKAEIEDEE